MEAPELSTTPADQDYTVSDLAHRMQCSDRHIWRLIDGKLIPGVYRIGRLVRLHRPTVDSWLASGAPSKWKIGR